MALPMVLLLGSLAGIGDRSAGWIDRGARLAVPAVAASGDASTAGSALMAQAQATFNSAPGPHVSKGGATGPNWTQITHPPPGGREGASLVWDAADHEYVLFGGWNGVTGLYRDTWTLSASGLWSKLGPSAAPSARWGSAIAYDGHDGYVLLFGGQGPSFTGAFADSWKFSGGTWTKLTTPTHPPAAAFGSMTYDARDGYVLLFGGYNATGTRLGATWEFKGGVWTHLTPLAPPPPRAAATMSFDAKDNYVLLFGGIGVSSFASDSWKYVGGNWTNLTTATAPQAREDAAMAYSAPDARLVLFGGLDGTGYLPQTWVYSSGNWSRLATALHPSKRYLPEMADAPTGGAVLLFGGFTTAGVASNETWSLAGNVWKMVGPLQPIARLGAAMAYDEADRFVLLFGGASASSLFSDTWKFVGGLWVPIHPATYPPARALAGMTYDAADGYVVLFGGTGCGHRCGDTWTFVHGSWTNVTGPGTSTAPVGPSPRAAPSMTYDAADGYVVLFGGSGPTLSSGYLNDTWTYLNGAWTMISPSTSPSPRYGAPITYDSEDGYVLLYEGVTGTTAYARDTWIFTGGIWDNISAGFVVSPSTATVYDTMFDDTYDGYVVLWVAQFDETWTWDGSTWAEIFPSATPPGGTLGSLGAYDPAAVSGVVLSSGTTWEYTG
ncbi:MAG: hypothetical protein L3K23_01750 [Thermoplasmata archaeon]|nr:hypothetical protein [Thermoplasmata archaeon]